MKPDVRYFAVTEHGRFRLHAEDDAEASLMARGMAERHRASLHRLIKETREELPL